MDAQGQTPLVTVKLGVGDIMPRALFAPLLGAKGMILMQPWTLVWESMCRLIVVISKPNNVAINS